MKSTRSNEISLYPHYGYHERITSAYFFKWVLACNCVLHIDIGIIACVLSQMQATLKFEISTEASLAGAVYLGQTVGSLFAFYLIRYADFY